VSSVRIPGNLLAEGMVHVNCHLRARVPNKIQFSEYSAVTFYVVDGFEGDTARGDWAKEMAGVVRPLLDWATEYHADRKGA